MRYALHAVVASQEKITLSPHLTELSLPPDSAVHQALAVLRDERNRERLANAILEGELRRIIGATYEATDAAVLVTQIRGIAGAALLTYRQERRARRRTWRDRLSAWWTTKLALWRAR